MWAYGTAAEAATARISFADLGYNDGVTVAGVAPSVTFDLPNYASLQAAVLHLELHVSDAAAPASTVTIAVNGTRVYARALREIGHDARLVVPLPVPPRRARLFAVTVAGALQLAGDPCGNGSSSKLLMRVGRDSDLQVRMTDGGSAEAFFRDYRTKIAITGATGDPALAAVPYRLDRLEPWHRVEATLVAAPPHSGRAIVFVPGAPTTRTGDVLTISPAAFAALPVPSGQPPQRRAHSVAFADLRQHLGSATGSGDLAFDVPLAGSITGGVPQRLNVHIALAHSALPPGVNATLQVLVNGVLAGARYVGRSAATETIDLAVPQPVVGASNNVRVLVAPDVSPAACAAGAIAITASLLDSSSFSWSSVERRPPTVESFITALNGRVVVLVEPSVTRAAFHLLDEVGKMNSAIDRLDVARYDGEVPDGYDYAIVFAPPDALAGLQLPARAEAPAFRVVNPTDDATVLAVTPATNLVLLQVGRSGATPVLAVSAHGAPGSFRLLEGVDAGQLSTQVASVSVAAGDGVTAYDIGDKLRVRYAGELTAAEIWSRVRLAVSAVCLIAIALGGRYVALRLTGRTSA
jgi:hypothetical protein